MAKRILSFLVVPVSLIVIYAALYLGTSTFSTEVMEGGYDWGTREFNHDWQVTVFKPMLGLESAWRDGDFSWRVNRAE